MVPHADAVYASSPSFSLDLRFVVMHCQSFLLADPKLPQLEHTSLSVPIFRQSPLGSPS